MQPMQFDVQVPGKVLVNWAEPPEHTAEGPLRAAVWGGPTFTTVEAVPGQAPTVVNVMVCEPEPAEFEKKNPVFWLMQVPQLAVQAPKAGVELKS
jgi:hypothetical protein